MTAHNAYRKDNEKMLQSKSDYEKLMLKILNPIKPYYSEGKAYLKLGAGGACYTEKASWIEGFSRPLWALAPYYAQPEGKDKSFAEIYCEGFKNGSNPFCPEYWGEIRDYDQVIVEMAAMGLALLLAPDTFFYSLGEDEQKNLASWLYTINDHKYPDNNWVMFEVIVNCGLKNVSMPYNDNMIEWGIKKLDEWYLGEGWYVDGCTKHSDYYVPFAIHFYSLIYAKYIEKAYPDRSNRLKDRAREFAKDYIYWFDKNGAAVAYGRSLTYRFAQAAFWSALVWADASPFPLPVVKGIINRNLEDWMSAPIFDKAELLTIGYKYPNLLMSEYYNAPGSPYWAMKTFLLLALPKDHEFFKAEEAPLPELEAVRPQKSAKMIFTNSETDAVIYANGLGVHGVDTQMPEKYGKFAYSAKYGFSVSRSSRSIEEASADSALSFLVKGNVYVNPASKSAEVLPDKRLKIEWSPCEGIEVETIITPYENSHKREHTIKAAFSCEAYDAGFAVPWDIDTTKTSAGEGEAEVMAKNGGCRVYSEYGEGVIIAAQPNTNLICPRTRIPAVKYQIPIGESKISSMVYELDQEQEKQSV